MKKGFTLIELLIVIAIIGILAVAFLPSLLGAPSKGRDTARLADLQKIQKVLVSGNLSGTSYPDTATTNCFDGVASNYTAALGGKTPADPQGTNATKIAASGGCTAAGGYTYIKDPGATKTYSFGLYALVENRDKANSKCSTALTGTIDPPVAATASNDLCYAILTQ